MSGNRWQASTRDDYFADLLAEPFAERGIGDRVRFDHSTGLWHIWDTFRWAPDRKTAILDLVRDRASDWIADAVNSGHGQDTIKLLSSILDTGKKQSVLKALASYPGIAMTGDEWDQNPELMGFNNGVLNLRTLVLDRTPDPKLLISRTTGVDWVDPGDEVLYTRFVAFIDDIMGGDADLRDYLLRILGYSMIGTNREQKFWMWVGQGQNGKGVLARVAAKAMGDYAATPPDTLYMRTKFGAASSDKPRPELLKLEGARFTYMSEPQGGQFNEEMLKAHTGNDFIEARTLHSKTFKTFQPTHKIIFLTNNPPRTDDVGPSMQRRVRIVWFEQDYRDPKRNDVTLEDTLKEERNLQGALQIMAIAAQEYLNQGIAEPQKVLDWSRAYIEENDPMSAFIAEMCVQDKAASEGAGAMWKAFDAWTDKAGVERMTQTGFGLAMGRKFEKKHTVAGKVYLGVRLKNATDRAAEAEDE